MTVGVVDSDSRENTASVTTATYLVVKNNKMKCKETGSTQG